MARTAQVQQRFRIRLHDLGAAPSVSNKLLDAWGPALFHYGESVNGWWRLFWFIFGVSAAG